MWLVSDISVLTKTSVFGTRRDKVQLLEKVLVLVKEVAVVEK